MLTGQRTRDVMREPYAHTLFTFLQSREHDRIERLLQRKRELDVAGLMVFAWHEPKKLGDEHHAWMHDVGLLPSDDEAIANVHDVIEAMRHLDAAAHASKESPATPTEESDGE